VQAVWCRLGRSERRRFRIAIRFGTAASLWVRARAALYTMAGLTSRHVASRLGSSCWLVRDATWRFIERWPIGPVDERRFVRGPRRLDQRVADLLLQALLKGLERCGVHGTTGA